MSQQREKIIQFTRRLQEQSVLPLWSISDENVICPASQNVKPIFGKNTKRLHYLISIARKLKLTDQLLFAVGFLKAFLIWKNIKMKFPLDYKKIEKVFAGFGASSEDHLYNEFKQSNGESVCYINWTNFSGMNQLSRPKFFQIVSELRKNAFGHAAKFKDAIPEIKSYEIDFLTVCAKHIGSFSFFCAYWKIAKSRGLKEVTFLAPDVPAYACVEANIETIFIQHGLMGLGILMPKFHKIHAITFAEKEYFEDLLPNTEIFKMNYPIKIFSKKNNTVIILSPNIHPGEHLQRMSLVEPFIEWARTNNMKIVIRPTYRVTENELSFFHEKFSDCIIDDIKVSLHQSLEIWQPKFITAWRSTSLAVALEYGYLSISFSDPQIDWNMIYPLRERVLFWPHDKDDVERALVSDDFYRMCNDRLRSFGN